jgi:threonine dehydratase
VSLSLSSIHEAAERIRGVAIRTPFLRAHALDADCGAQVFVKPEMLQPAGSFKIRGAMSRMTLLSADERARGVVAFSSGNHAQAVAYAAKILETSATIVMPTDAPALKIANTRNYGAEVILYDRYREDREAIGRKLAEERRLTLVPPFDDYRVMAGQGTIGLEIAEDMAAQNIAIYAVLINCSGGGLAAGVATALKALSPQTKVYAVEPVQFNDTARSFEKGERVANPKGIRSICDALLVDQPGALTFPINRELLAGVFTVTDDEVRHAMRMAFEKLKLVVEPGGAAALAAALFGKLPIPAKSIAVVLSGGNVDPQSFAEIIGQKPA